jgi:hypothetical protein
VLSNKIFYQYLARLMQRQRKLGTSNLVSSIIEQVSSARESITGV